MVTIYYFIEDTFIWFSVQKIQLYVVSFEIFSLVYLPHNSPPCSQLMYQFVYLDIFCISKSKNVYSQLFLKNMNEIILFHVSFLSLKMYLSYSYQLNLFLNNCG